MSVVLRAIAKRPNIIIALDTTMLLLAIVLKRACGKKFAGSHIHIERDGVESTCRTKSSGPLDNTNELK